MNYKDQGIAQNFLSKEDINETKNSIFFHFDSPSVKDNIEAIFDYLKKIGWNIF